MFHENIEAEKLLRVSSLFKSLEQTFFTKLMGGRDGERKGRENKGRIIVTVREIDRSGYPYAIFYPYL